MLNSIDWRRNSYLMLKLCLWELLVLFKLNVPIFQKVNYYILFEAD